MDAYGIEQYDFHRVNVSGETSVTCNDKDYKIASGMILDALRLGLRPKPNLETDLTTIAHRTGVTNTIPKLEPTAKILGPNSNQIKVSVVST